MIYPTGILKNTSTDRFHPISFRRAPMPGGSDNDSVAKLHKSLGHHFEGIDTLEEAQQWVNDQENMSLVGVVWECDGEDTPAMIEWFNEPS